MADNYSATAGSGLTFAADEIAGVKHARVKIEVGVDGAATDVSASNPMPVGGAAADDAAVSGNPVPMGGTYQATPDEIDTGDIGIVRLSARRGQIVVPDFHSVVLSNSSVSGYGDIEVSTVGELSSYTIPTTAFFNGADAGFNSNARHIKIPMGVAGWRDCEIIFQNQLGTNCQFTVKAMATWDTNWLSIYAIYDVTVNSASSASIAPYAAGTGGVSWVAVPALVNPNAYLIVSIDPVADPSSGYFALSVARRA